MPTQISTTFGVFQTITVPSLYVLEADDTSWGYNDGWVFGLQEVGLLGHLYGHPDAGIPFRQIFDVFIAERARDDAHLLMPGACQINMSQASRNLEPEWVTLPMSRFAIPPSPGCGIFAVCDER